MNDLFTKTFAWIKSNLLLSLGIGLVIIFMFFGRQVKRMFFGGSPRRRHRKAKATTVKYRVNRRRRARVNRKPLPRSVGTSKKGYPKAGGGYIPFKRNKNGTIKKAWQVAGTVAAKARMRRLRKNR